MRETKLHYQYPVSPCPPARGQESAEKQNSPLPGKGRRWWRELPPNPGVCILAEEHALCCVLVIAQFVYMVTHSLMLLLFVLQ